MIFLLPPGINGLRIEVRFVFLHLTFLGNIIFWKWYTAIYFIRQSNIFCNAPRLYLPFWNYSFRDTWIGKTHIFRISLVYLVFLESSLNYCSFPKLLVLLRIMRLKKFAILIKNSGIFFFNFIEVTLRHGCSPVNLLHNFRPPFPKNSSGGLLPNIITSSKVTKMSFKKEENIWSENFG